jgi:hypothetical protein
MVLSGPGRSAGEQASSATAVSRPRRASFRPAFRLPKKQTISPPAIGIGGERATLFRPCGLAASNPLGAIAPFPMKQSSSPPPCPPRARAIVIGRWGTGDLGFSDRYAELLLRDGRKPATHGPSPGPFHGAIDRRQESNLRCHGAKYPKPSPPAWTSREDRGKSFRGNK